MAELAKPQEQAEAERPKGMFEGLLGDLSVLHEDLVRHPEKYEAEVRALIIRRVGEGRTGTEYLSPQELELLDRATLDFAQTARPKQAPKRIQRQQPAKKTPTKKPKERKPVIDYLKTQRRFRHLMDKPEELEKIQKEVDEKCSRYGF
jgi:hypothetical protein